MKKVLVLLCLMMFMPFSAQSIEYRWENEVGKDMSISSLQGESVVLHFWASWCPPCRSEMPALVEWTVTHPEVKVVIVSLDRDRDSAQGFFEERGIKLPLNMGNMRDASKLGVRGLPSTFIISKNGEVKKRHAGDIKWDNQQVSDEVLSWL